MAKLRQLKIQSKITNRNVNIERYFIDLNKYGGITPTEEIELAEKIQHGDIDARNKLIRANLRFVISVAKQYASNDVNLFSDLIQHGSVGLVKAAESFDSTRGFKFISYAVWKIRKEIFEYLNNYSRTVRQPTNFVNDSTRVRNAESTLFTELGRDPDYSEILDKVISNGYKITDSRIDFVKTNGVSTVPIDFPQFEEAGSPIDWIDSGERTDHRAMQSDISIAASSLLDKLSEPDADIVRKVHGINGPQYSFMEISQELNRPSVWVRQRYSKAIRKLRVTSHSIDIKNLL